MKVMVKLFATFRNGRFAGEHREYPLGALVGDVIRELQIPEKELGMLLLNARHVEPCAALQDGDTLSVFPLVGGG